MAAEDPSAPDEPQYVLRERHEVALFDEGDEGHNVIVVGGIDVVVPVELDLDGDPFADDQVSLRSVHGLYEHVLTAGHPDVRADLELGVAYYRFRYVPPGIYRVAVMTGDHWVQLGSDLSVRRDGVYWNGQKLSAEAPEIEIADVEDVLDLAELAEDDVLRETDGHDEEDERG